MRHRYRLHYAPDNASLVIRLALLELGQPFETVLIDRKARNQTAPEYLRLNPVGRIPALETPHGPVFETAAILLWLADTHHALLPAPDAPDRGAALSWLFFMSNTLHAELRMLFYPETYTGPGHTAPMRQTLHTSLTRHLILLNQTAAERPAWLNGPALSALDLYLCSLLRWCALYPAGGTDWFRLADFPALHALAIRTEARDTVRNAAQAEGLGATPFSHPHLPDPPEGSAT